MVVVGEHAGNLDFDAYAGEEWLETVTLTEADGSAWSWTGKTVKMTIALRSGATPVATLNSGSDPGLGITTPGQIAIMADLDGVAARLYRYDLWETVTATNKARPILAGYFRVKPAMTATP